jgi:hypothetical protein
MDVCRRIAGMKNSPFSQARESVNMTCTTSIDAMFKRKRGRPPKNRVIEVGALVLGVSQRPVLDKYIHLIQHQHLCRKKG